MKLPPGMSYEQCFRELERAITDLEDKVEKLRQLSKPASSSSSSYHYTGLCTCWAEYNGLPEHNRTCPARRS